MAASIGPERNGGGARGEHRAVLRLRPHLEFDDRLFGALSNLSHTPACDRADAAQARCAQLARHRHDATVLADPLAEQRVQVRDLKVAHPERTGVARAPSRVVIHVNGDELLVHRRISVPRVETRFSLERRYFLPDRDGHHHLGTSGQYRSPVPRVTLTISSR